MAQINYKDGSRSLVFFESGLVAPVCSSVMENGQLDKVLLASSKRKVALLRFKSGLLALLNFNSSPLEQEPVQLSNDEYLDLVLTPGAFSSSPESFTGEIDT